MQKLVTRALLAIVLAMPVAVTDGSIDSASAAEPRDALPVMTDGASPQIIFLRDGRAIQVEGSETLGNSVRIETPTGSIDLPSSEILSIHRVESPSGPRSSQDPADVYRGLTQQMTDQVRRQIQGQSGPPRVN